MHGTDHHVQQHNEAYVFICVCLCLSNIVCSFDSPLELFRYTFIRNKLFILQHRTHRWQYIFQWKASIQMTKPTDNQVKELFFIIAIRSHALVCNWWSIFIGAKQKMLHNENNWEVYIPKIKRNIDRKKELNSMRWQWTFCCVSHNNVNKIRS